MEEPCKVAYMTYRPYIALSCTYIIEMLIVTFVYTDKRLNLNGKEL